MLLMTWGERGMYSHTGSSHRLLRQRGKSAGRQLVSVSASSRGHAYELNEHQIPAVMVRKSASPTERPKAKNSNIC